MSKSKFDFFERIEIYSKRKNLKKIFGKKGTLLAKGHDEKCGWYYGVGVDDYHGCQVMESDLKSLGTFVKRESIYTGESIRVGVNNKGEGYIIEVNIKDEES